MPQAPTANMGLIKPAELGDSGVWASLLDAMFDLIDAHDHSAGKGVKVPMSTGVNVAADIPWSSAGTFYAIKDLKAIDFQPQPQSAMTGFAGALFVDSANNELSYRTTGGAIIRFTNGATFNFAAIGGIGGDYSAAGALVDFVDANDLYRFRQQLGGGVQQYARLDCGGVDLFEFKANPAAGVPANRVRHSSPAGLAASYEVTWPTALPAAGFTGTAAGIVQLSTSGVLTAVGTTWTVPVSAGQIAAGQTETIGGGGVGNALFWNLNASVVGVQIPFELPLGATITGWSVQCNKASAAGTITATLYDWSSGGGAAIVGAPQTNAAVSPGLIFLSQAGLPTSGGTATTVQSGHQYYILVRGGGTVGDTLLQAQVVT